MEHLYFRLRSLNRICFNTTMIRRRSFHGHILSMQQSGTHWVRHMLSVALAEKHGKPEPETIQCTDFIGRPKSQPVYPDIPQIVSSHTLPHVIQFMPGLPNNLHFPRYLILVRDMRHSLVSHFEKWKERYQVDFATYLRAKPWGKPYFNDIWRQIEFLNLWGAIVADPRYRTHVVQYEQLKADTAGQFNNICNFLELAIPPDAQARAVQAASKDSMAKMSKARNNEQVVRQDTRPPLSWFKPQDRDFLLNLMDRELKHDFGYPYTEWDDA